MLVDMNKSKSTQAIFFHRRPQVGFKSSQCTERLHSAVAVVIDRVKSAVNALDKFGNSCG